MSAARSILGRKTAQTNASWPLAILALAHCVTGPLLSLPHPCYPYRFASILEGMMANRRWFASIVIAGILGFLSVTLGASQPQTPSATRNHRLAKPVRTSLVAWGSGHGQVGLRRSPQQPSEGVSSLTIATDGSTLLLDRVNQRVVQLSPSGSITDVWTISPTPPPTPKT